MLGILESERYTPVVAVLPENDRPVEQAQGHWLLAHMGKKVLRPGGIALTHSMLERAQLRGKKVLEFAPGLGATARLILAHKPATYTGVDLDLQAVDLVRKVILESGYDGQARVINASADNTGLEEGCAEIVIGEAMLTMQGEKAKAGIIAEAYRVLAPGGTYCIHELAHAPEDITEEHVATIRKDLARSIRVNARPLTITEWSNLLEKAGFRVEAYRLAPMKLLDPVRIIADEGLVGALTFFTNMCKNPEARTRILGMRKAFRRHRKNLAGVSIIAVKE